MAAKKADKKTKKSKFRFPAVEDRCAKEIIPKGKFHPPSFRNTIVRTPKSPDKKAIVMVGCPKFVKGRGMKKAYPTTWYTSPVAVKTRTQCRWTEGPKAGQKAGMRAHVIIEPKGKSSRCRAGYEKAETKKAAAKRRSK